MGLITHRWWLVISPRRRGPHGGHMPDMSHIAAPMPLSDSAIKPEGLVARAVDWVFGYDFFVSYSHGDGMRLPRRIKDRLEQAGFRVFLDQTEYVAGDDLRRET